jgi:Fur family peroxide stress response transcriptional regulator
MNRKDLIFMLRENGYKVTPQRLAICQEVLSSEDHPTAEQIFEKVSKQHPTISITTIYHTLNMLMKLNLVSELGFNNQSSRFDPNTAVHVNVICQQCNKIWDYKSEAIENQWAHIIAKMKVNPIGQRLDVYVICEDCKD